MRRVWAGGTLVAGCRPTVVTGEALFPGCRWKLRVGDFANTLPAALRRLHPWAAPCPGRPTLGTCEEQAALTLGWLLLRGARPRGLCLGPAAPCLALSCQGWRTCDFVPVPRVPACICACDECELPCMCLPATCLSEPGAGPTDQVFLTPAGGVVGVTSLLLACVVLHLLCAPHLAGLCPGWRGPLQAPAW